MSLRQRPTRQTSDQTPLPGSPGESSVQQQKKSAVASNRNEGIPSNVMVKLLLFSVFMVVGPIATYFITLKYVFEGNGTYSALSAVFVTNLVVALYVYVAFIEDS